MNMDELLRRLGASLQEEIRAAERFLDILQQEHAALSSSDPGAVEQIGRLKADALGTLEQTGRQRAALIASAGFDAADKQGIETLIQRADPGHRTPVAEQWQRLRELAGECQRLNTINGAVIQSSFRFAQQALALLRGHTPGGTLEYRPDGSTRQPMGSSTLAKA